MLTTTLSLRDQAAAGGSSINTFLWNLVLWVVLRSFMLFMSLASTVTFDAQIKPFEQMGFGLPPYSF